MYPPSGSSPAACCGSPPVVLFFCCGGGDEPSCMSSYFRMGPFCTQPLHCADSQGIQRVITPAPHLSLLILSLSLCQAYKSPETLHSASVNSICWAPQELGLMLACGSSDGTISILNHNADGAWSTDKAWEPISPFCVCGIFDTGSSEVSALSPYTY